MSAPKIDARGRSLQDVRGHENHGLCLCVVCRRAERRYVWSSNRSYMTADEVRSESMGVKPDTYSDANGDSLKQGCDQ